MMTTRRFSIEEANALLPQLEILLTRLFEKRESHERLHDHLFMDELIHEATKHKKTGASSEDSQKLESGAREVDGRLEDFAAEIEAIRGLGCFLRSLERGMIEFPAEHRGQTVYFSWKKGEARIQYYRPAQGNPGERLPL